MRRLMLAALLLAAAPTLAPVAHAQEEMCSPYNNVQFRNDVVAAGRALDAADIREARYVLGQTRSKLRCLDRLVDRKQLAIFARQMALLFFYDQDPETARRWGLLSRDADPDLPWEEFTFPPEHPFREALEEEEDAFVGRPSGVVLAPPKRGGIFMNGRLILEPEAPAEVPVLMQVADAKGNVVVGFWQDGARFPDQILVAGDKPPKPPRWYDGEVQRASAAPADAVALAPDAVAEAPDAPPDEPVVRPERPEREPKPLREPKPPREPRTRDADGLPIVPIAVAGGLLVGAGALAAGAAISHGRLGKATTEDQLRSVQTTTNALTLTAGVLTVGAIGTGVTVFLLEEGGGAGLRIRW